MKNNVGKKTVKLGIELLRFFLCLWIVIIHCSNLKPKYEKYLSKSFHVPTFILISFYFYYNILKKRIISKIILRFQRLLFPYILWPIIDLIINNFLFSILSSSQFNKKLTFTDLYIQILMAARFFPSFWFHFNLLFLTLIFTIIAFIFKQFISNILISLAILSFYFHYSRINFYKFKDYKKFCGYNMGSLVEMTPLAVLGCFLNSINILTKTNFYSIFNSIYLNINLIFILFLLFEYEIFVHYAGLRYPDILLNSFASLTLFLLFGFMQIEKIKNEKFNSIIKNITKYTGGIYYIHVIFRDYLQRYIFYFRKRQFLSAVIIYIICYFFCFMGNTIFKNNKLK